MANKGREWAHEDTAVLERPLAVHDREKARRRSDGTQLSSRLVGSSSCWRASGVGELLHSLLS
jgi:hypothetical protein